MDTTSLSRLDNIIPASSPLRRPIVSSVREVPTEAPPVIPSRSAPMTPVESPDCKPRIVEPELISQTWIPRVLVIGPGGVKGIKALGFLSPVEDSGILDYVDTHSGVSIGAIISLLIICGYQIREIIKEAVTLNLFKEISALDCRSIIENRGFISSEPVRRHLTQLVINKFGNVPTLHGLYMMTGKAFIAVTLNATDEVCVMMNPFDNPDVSCVDAAMFSMNIPFVFYQLIHRGKVYVDGALANPYPVDYFDDGKTNILGIYMKPVQPKNTVSPHPPGVIVQRVDAPITSVPLSVYPLKIINAMMDQRRNHIIQHTSSCCKHVCLEVTNDDTLGRDITIEDKAKMLVEGFNEGKAFVDEILSNTYIGPKIPAKLHYAYPPYFMVGESNDPEEESPVQILTEMSGEH